MNFFENLPGLCGNAHGLCTYKGKDMQPKPERFSSIFWSAGAERSGDPALASSTCDGRIHQIVTVTEPVDGAPSPGGEGRGEGERSFSTASFRLSP